MPTLEELQKKYGRNNSSQEEKSKEKKAQSPVIENLRIKENKPKTSKKEIINLDISELPLNASARLNLIKFLYPLLTGNSTTNKLKKEMKKSVMDKIKEF